MKIHPNIHYTGGSTALSVGFGKDRAGAPAITGFELYLRWRRVKQINYAAWGAFSR